MNIGDRFGRLTIIAESPRMYRKVAYLCACDCGGKKTLPATALRSGNTKSCGCLHRETSTALCLSRTKHGHGRRSGISRTYHSWSGAVQRCTNPKSPNWPQYGGRGIKVCERWQSDFAVFLADMGVRPAGRTLDRIDGAGNYEPGNCRWATVEEQGQNTRRTRLNAALVVVIRADLATGRRASEIADGLRVTRSSVGNVKRRKTWRNVA